MDTAKTNNSTSEFENEIFELISLGAEGDYWDFKLQWHTNLSDLLYDIICMANNLANHDAYIIIGVKDETHNIIGVDTNDKNRKNQQQLIDFIKDKPFSSGVRPTVYVKNIEYDDKIIDVIIIKNSDKTPYYLTDDFQGIFKGNIYTRIGDTNTPKNKTADDDKTAYLWRKRFGIDLTPFEKAKFLLQNPKDWHPMATDGVHETPIYECRNVWFNIHHPEYTIKIVEESFTSSLTKCSEINKIIMEMYWLNQMPQPCVLHNTYYNILSISYANSVLYATPVVFADNFRFKRVQWKNDSIHDSVSRNWFIFCYIEKDSIDFLLDNWLCVCAETVDHINHTSEQLSNDMTTQRFCEYQDKNPYQVVPVFENTEEHQSFKQYVVAHANEFFEEVGTYDPSSSPDAGKIARAYDPHYIEYLCKTGEKVVEWLVRWRTATQTD
jgi:hypothetical protein